VSWLTPEEVAAELRVSLDTVYRLIRSATLPALEVGGQYRIARTDLDAFTARRVTPIAPPTTTRRKPRVLA
jgi:putative molybdopterin biosynthesis protein